ncbi:MFS transporter [Bacillus amyloliquefaciens]
MPVIKSNNIKNRIVIAGAIDSFGASIVWTGLPLYAYSITGSFLYTSSLFFTTAIARIIATFLGGYLADVSSSKKIMIRCLSINWICYLFLFSGLFFKFTWIIFPVMLISQGLSTISNMNQNLWFNSLCSKETLASEISGRNSWFLVSKTTGFSLGPLIYNYLNAYSLLINLVTIIFAISLISSIKNKGYVSVARKKDNIFNSFKEVYRNQLLKRLNIIEILNGLTFPVLTSLSIYILQKNLDASSITISSFWFIGGVGAVVANIALSRLKLFKLKYVYLFVISFSLIIGGLMLMTVANVPLVYLIGFSLFTLGTPIINNLLRSKVFIHAPKDMKGKITSVITSSSDLGTVLALSISWIIVEKFGAISFMFFVIGTSVFRICLFFFTLHKVESSMEVRG